MTCINCVVEITEVTAHQHGAHVKVLYRGSAHNWFYLWARPTDFFTFFRLLGRIVNSLSYYHSLPMSK